MVVTLTTHCFYLHKSILPFSELPHLFSYSEGREWGPECTNISKKKIKWTRREKV